MIHQFSLETQIMRTIPGIIGLVLILLASMEVNGKKKQSLPAETALRVQFNETETMLQEVNM